MGFLLFVFRGCDFGIYVVSVRCFFGMMVATTLFLMFDMNSFSCIYVSWTVLLADGIWLAGFAGKFRMFLEKHGRHVRMFEPAICRIVVRAMCFSQGVM